ncbi:hypothetical protein RND81_01G225800 [Saponaria officinalis]|uniref:Protein kinase domain-containing protein n=1 Tax=Saponaria officinalis TaxID=3572 RepID=A0AAW1NHT2_SAPOF
MKTPLSVSVGVFILATLVTLTCADLDSTRSALLALREALGGRTLLWNTGSPPCSWHGVQCKNDIVVALQLPGFSLSAQIPPGIFKNLTSLKLLSLRFNQISGNLPSDLGLCTQIRSIYLQDNNFTGVIPEFFTQLKKIVRLNLANNDFTGEIPRSLRNLTRLKTLYLENNRFTGFLPELKLELDQFNVSNNKLNGTIPVSLESMPVSAFGGTKLCGKPLQICPGIAAGTGVFTRELHNKKGLSGGAIAGIVVGAVVAFAIILMILVFTCGKKKRKQTNAVPFSSINKQIEVDVSGEIPVRDGGDVGFSNGVASTAVPVNGNGRNIEEVDGGGVNKKLVFFGNGVGGKLFDLEELLRASAEVLGKGTFGTSYKAVTEIGTIVVVKRLRDVTISEGEFKEKVEVVGAINHENLVPLRAYYYSLDEKLLVYDYMPTGSLSAYLHGNKGAGRTSLNWEMRSSIALGVARGITYLHSQGSNVSHGNIKSSNILLTNSYKPMVSDLGLAQLVGPSSSSTPNRVNGYRAPEVTDLRKVSQQADVYSFGVLLLELLTGKAPTHALVNEEGVDLPRWVQSVVKDEWASEVFDIELLRDQHAEEEMVLLLEVAIECAAQYPGSRPSMSEANRRIQQLCDSTYKQADGFNPAMSGEIDDIASP